MRSALTYCILYESIGVVMVGFLCICKVKLKVTKSLSELITSFPDVLHCGWANIKAAGNFRDEIHTVTAVVYFKAADGQHRYCKPTG